MALKVQRPKILENISLDLFLIRNVASYCQNTLKTKTKWANFIDNYSIRFYAELDYLEEA